MGRPQRNFRALDFEAVAPCNGRSGELLADAIIGIIASIQGVRTILDIGCGNGYLAGRLAGLGYEVVGVDASETGVALAAKTFGSAAARFYVGQIDAELPRRLGLSTFDMVISSDVIEHLFRPADLLECARMALEPSGHMVLGTPYHGYLKNIALSLLDKWDDHHGVEWDGGHIKFFSVKTLSRLVVRHGFSWPKFHFCGRAPYLWKNMICVTRKQN